MKFIVKILLTIVICACASPLLSWQPSWAGNAGKIKVTGVLAEGVECPVLRAKNGKTYSLSANTKSAKSLLNSAGQSVTIIGRPLGASFCMQGQHLQVIKIVPAK